MSPRSIEVIAITRRAPVGGSMKPYVSGLHWDVLVALFGGESAVLVRARRLATTHPEDEDLTQVLQFAEKYAEGWRPTPFGE